MVDRNVSPYTVLSLYSKISEKNDVLNPFCTIFLENSLYFIAIKKHTLSSYIWATNGGNTMKFDCKVPGVGPIGVKFEKY